MRVFVKRDAYFPHTCSEVAALVPPGVAERLDPQRSYGISWASRHDWKILGRERLPDGRYRDRRKRGEKPREEWLALPTPHASVPREVAERARRNVELRVSPQKKNRRFWDLSGRVLRACHGRPHCRPEGAQNSLLLRVPQKGRGGMAVGLPEPQPPRW